MQSRIIELRELIQYLGDDIMEIYGNPDHITIHYLRDPQNVDEYTLDWINPNKPDQQQLTETSKAKAVIVKKGIQYTQVLKQQGKAILLVDNPKLCIAKIGQKYFKEVQEYKIFSSAVIHPEAKMGSRIVIGHNCVIGKCTIGNDVFIGPNVVIHDNVEIGNNVNIKSGAILGGEGFGFEKDQGGRWIKFPQLGRLLIYDDVEIGSHTCIDRGALSDTVVGKGSKINNLCHIAHNVVIGENVIITAHVNISGTTTIEDSVWIAPNASMRDIKPSVVIL